MTGQKAKLKKQYFKDATALFKSGKYEEAIEKWEKVLEIDPEHALSLSKIEKARQKIIETGHHFQ